MKKLSAAADPLAALRREFDRLVERMQTPEQAAAADALFAASGAELGALAVAHAAIHGAPEPRQYNPPHPGEVLSRLWMEPLNLTVTAVANSLGVARKTVSKLVNGLAAVTPEMAVRLEIAFGTSAAVWLGHQAAFDLWQLHQQRHSLVKQVTPIAARPAAAQVNDGGPRGKPRRRRK